MFTPAPHGSHSFTLKRRAEVRACISDACSVLMFLHVPKIPVWGSHREEKAAHPRVRAGLC